MDENVCDIWQLGISGLLLILYYMWLASGCNKFDLILICMVSFMPGEFYINYKVQLFNFSTERTV